MNAGYVQKKSGALIQPVLLDPVSAKEPKNMCTIDVQENGCSPPRKCTAKYVYTLMRYTQREILGLKLLGDLRGGEVQQDQLREAWENWHLFTQQENQTQIQDQIISKSMSMSKSQNQISLGSLEILRNISTEFINSQDFQDIVPTFILDYYLQSKHNLDNYIRNVFWAFFDEQPKNILNSKMPDLQYDEETQSNNTCPIYNQLEFFYQNLLQCTLHDQFQLQLSENIFRPTQFYNDQDQHNPQIDEYDYDVVIKDQPIQDFTNQNQVKQQIDYKRSEFFILKVLLLASFTLLGWMLAMAAYLKYIFKLLLRDYKWFKRQIQAKRFVNYKKSQQYQRVLEFKEDSQEQN